MINEPVTLPESEEAQVRDLNRMLQLGTPALVGADGERLALPNAVFRLLKDIVRNMYWRSRTLLITTRKHLPPVPNSDRLSVTIRHLIMLAKNGAAISHKTASI